MTQTLHIDPEFKAQIPPLTQEEHKQLEENILAEGALLLQSLFGTAPLWTDTTAMKFCKAIRKFHAASGTWNWKHGMKSSSGFANTSLAAGT